MNELKDKLNPGHYLELMDRLNLIMDIMESHCIQHPLAKTERNVRNLLYNAIDNIYDAYEEVSKLDYERNKSQIFIYAMIRYTKYINSKYIVIDSTLEIDDMIIPVQVQINVNKVKEEEQSKVYRIVNTAFNRNISFNRPKKQPNKPWYKFW